MRTDGLPMVRAHGPVLLPGTRLGHAAAWLGLAFVVWFVFNQTFVGLRATLPDLPGIVIIIVLGWAGLATGLAAGIVSLLAVARQHERSVVAFLCMVPMAMVALLLVGELLVPH